MSESENKSVREAVRVVAERFTKPLWLVAAAVFIAGVSALGAIWLDRNDVPGAVARRVQAWLSQPGPQTIAWRDVSTHYHQLKVAEFPVSNAVIEGGSLEEVGEGLLIASPQGRLSFLDAQGQLHALSPNVPMNLDAIEQMRASHGGVFNTASLRTMDLLAVSTGENTVDLYASHDQIGDDCIEFVISRIVLTISAGMPTPTGAWSEVWRARNCLRFSERGQSLEYPPATGGRMVMRSAEEMLISVGDYGHIGTGRPTESMNTANDFGKIIGLNVRTGSARQVAVGFRNPQGLTIDALGRAWETEHGPNGGDELNLVRDGGNYGWPIVTYGMDYTTPPVRWPEAEAIGTHDGYVGPRQAFLPSIGISNLVAPDARVFPHWEGGLLVASLRGQTLYFVRLDGDDVIFAEPIPLGHRLRDIITRRDGSLALLTDGGQLMLIRNAEAGPAEPFVVSGLGSLSPPLPSEAPRADASPEELGRSYFEAACASCHSVTGEGRAGPPLNGVVGRDIASVEGFMYSEALRELDGVWTEDRLRAFIAEPNAIAPGTAMPQPALRPRAPARIVDYLKTVRNERRDN
jgi:cytochrome c2